MQYDNLNSHHFIVGIKNVIQTYPGTQGEFAEGVCSKVNLSNVLRGNGGTSEKMRRKLAEKAGMTVEDVIALGKQASIPKTPITTKTELFTELSGMSSTEIINKTSTYTAELTESMVTHTRVINNAITQLTQERAKLIEMLHVEQSTINSIDARIKVVNRDNIITNCNKAYTEHTHQVEGDLCNEGDCTLCQNKGHECLVTTVFKTGQSIRVMYETPSGNWEVKSAYPQMANTGLVDKVVIMTRDITSIIDHIKSNGITDMLS